MWFIFFITTVLFIVLWFKAKKRFKAAQGTISRLQGMLSPEQAELNTLQEKIESANKELQGIQKEADKTTQRLEAQVSMLQSSIAQKSYELERLNSEIIETRDEVLVQSYGLYHPRYSFINSDEYKSRLMEIRSRQKEMVKSGCAVTGASDWVINGNAAKGKKMVSDTQKLLLRAFNAECDDVIEHVKYSNIASSEKRITASRDAISKLGNIMSIAITYPYFILKIEELYLAFEYQLKKHEEKEAQKEARAQMREEAKLAKEIEAQRAKLEKEQAHYKNVLKQLNAQFSTATSDEEIESLNEKKAKLEEQLGEISKAIADVDYRVANQRAGYVYVISNIGAFGENVYKIGMTRRLDPTERVDELGDASVPFNFDIHAMIFSEDAPRLEAALHEAFSDRKLNMVNTRREFFRVTLDEIEAVVKKNYDKTVEFVRVAPADQYRQSELLRAQA